MDKKEKKKRIVQKNKKVNSTNKKKKSNLTNIILIAIMVIGLLIVIYPEFSNWWNKQHTTKAIATYVEEVEKIDDGSKQAMIDKAVEFNKRLTNLNFSFTVEQQQEYESILDVSGTGIMGYIQIPTINVNLPIYHGTSDAVLSVAVGHIEGTAFPVGGKGTHSVLSGHRGLPSAKLFSDLDLLKEGDIFVISVLDQMLTYQIDQIHIVLPEEVSDLAINHNEDYVTLVTCTPYGVNTHRMLVRGRRIDNIKDLSDIVVNSEATRISPTLVVLGIAVPLIIVAMIISFIIPREKKVDTKKLLKDIHKSVGTRGDKDED